MTTEIKGLGHKRKINHGQTDFRDGVNTNYVVEDFGIGPRTFIPGFSITKFVETKPGEIIYCYPLLNPNPNTEIKLSSKTVRVSFISD